VYLSRSNELSLQLSAADLQHTQMVTLGKEFAELSRLMILVDERDSKKTSIRELTALEAEERSKGPDGEEMAQLAQLEREELEAGLVDVEQNIIKFVTPRDVHDERNVVLEVRAGTGGDEASLFAGEIFKMYQKYAQLMGWKWEELSLTKSEIGGFKEAQAQINGDSVFRHLKFEAGVHRVQRIPVNDTKIQTSAASVIVLPEADEVDVDIRPQDLKIDVFRSSGAGGQSVNRTESAVRMTHIPTGIVVAMQVSDKLY
jgi:peptide chain release factor 1